MNYEQVRQLKEKVEVFENTSFVSVLSANELLLLNEKTGDTWSVEYSYEEDALVLHGDTAVCVEHNSTVDEEDENLSLEKVNEALLLSYSDNNKSAFSEGLSYLPQLIAERKKSKPKSTEKVTKLYSENYERHSEETKNFAEEFYNEWADKQSEVASNFKRVFEAGFLFEEDGSFKSGDVLDPVVTLESYRTEKEDHEQYLESAEGLVNFYKELEDYGVPSHCLKDLQLNESSWESTLTRNLVHEKQSGANINVLETVTLAKELHSALLEDSPHWYNYHNNDNSAYLKSGLYGGSNVYTPHDLEKLIGDLTRATSTYINNGFTREELAEVSDMKDAIDTMYRTNKISDEEVAKVVDNFNSKFGVRKTSIYEPLKNYVGV